MVISPLASEKKGLIGHRILALMDVYLLLHSIIGLLFHEEFTRLSRHHALLVHSLPEVKLPHFGILLADVVDCLGVLIVFVDLFAHVRGALEVVGVDLSDLRAHNFMLRPGTTDEPLA